MTASATIRPSDRDSLAKSSQRSPLAAVRSAPTSPVRIRPVLQIGSLGDGPDDKNIFGKIRELELDAQGNLYVLDEQALSVRWFGDDGLARGSAGKAGGGPGEFRGPVGIELDDSGQVHVLDLALKRISTFVPTDSGLVLKTTVQTPFPAMDICHIKDQWYLLSPQEGGIVHELTRSGELARSFGAVTLGVGPEFKNHEKILKQIQTRGRLYCSNAPEAIVVVHERQPVVRAFTADGKMIWQTTLSNFHPVRWEVARDGRALQMGIDPRAGVAHTVMYIARTDADVIAVTVHEGSLTNPEGTLQVHSLSLRDGHEISSARSPFIVAAIRDTLTYGLIDYPFPRIVVLAQPASRNEKQ